MKLSTYRHPSRRDLPVWFRVVTLRRSMGLGLWHAPRSYQQTSWKGPMRPRLRVGRRTWVLLPVKESE